MNESLALLLAILYLIYRFKTYKKTNKIIEDRIENVHKPYYKIDDSTYSFVDAGGLKGTFSIDQNYNLLTLVYNDVDLLALHQV